jgi:hypothetical protein
MILFAICAYSALSCVMAYIDNIPEQLITTRGEYLHLDLARWAPGDIINISIINKENMLGLSSAKLVHSALANIKYNFFPQIYFLKPERARALFLSPKIF